jgi:GTP-binding protein EngB required for normal cell division
MKPESAATSATHSREKRPALNESHIRHIVSNFQYADKLLSDIEGVLTAAASRTVFPKYIPDITPAQAKVVEDYLARIRAQLIRVLASFGIEPPPPRTGSIHAVRVTLSFVRVAIEESAPRYLVGYGPVPKELMPELEGLSNELEGLVLKLDRFLAQGPGHDLKTRLARLQESGDEIETLKRLEEVISRHGLVEFHTALSSILERLTDVRLEIAVFGQVSSGKSSLLNHILGKDLLPVGVNPITAVPTRIVNGDDEAVSVTFADRKTERHALADLSQFVSEQYNPGNARGVAKIVVEVKTDRVERGIVFVDTPGLGSLATSGAAETRAYLPHCDLGVVLINAGSTLGLEDIATIQSLYAAGVAPAVLLSKADLLRPADRSRALDYIRTKLQTELGVELPVYPVSVVGEHEELLSAWFREHLVPLFAERQTLVRESIRRKIGVLRESVQAALKSKLHPGAKAVSANRVDAADRQLRIASGELSKLEKFCLDKTDAIRDVGDLAVRWAAILLFRAWKSEKPFTVTGAVRDAVVETASQEAGEVVSALHKTAEALAAALDAAADVLGEDGGPVQDEMAAALREMPQIETSGIHLELGRPIVILLGQSIATGWIERKIENACGPQITQAFVSYARVLQVWALQAIAALTRIFDTRADAYRAQIERMLGRAPAAAAGADQIEADLQVLNEPVLPGRV